MTTEPKSPTQPANVGQLKPKRLTPKARRALARRNVEAARQDYEDALAIARHVAKASGGDPNALMWDYRDRDSEGSK